MLVFAPAHEVLQQRVRGAGNAGEVQREERRRSRRWESRVLQTASDGSMAAETATRTMKPTNQPIASRAPTNSNAPNGDVNAHRHTTDELLKPPRLHCRRNGNTRRHAQLAGSEQPVAPRSREGVDARRRCQLVGERDRGCRATTRRAVYVRYPQAREARHQRRGQDQDLLAEAKIRRVGSLRADVRHALQRDGKRAHRPVTQQASGGLVRWHLDRSPFDAGHHFVLGAAVGSHPTGSAAGTGGSA